MLNNNSSGDLLHSRLRCIFSPCNSSDGMVVYYHPENVKKKHQLRCFSCNKSKYLFEDEYEELDLGDSKGYKDENKFKRKKDIQPMINPNQSFLPTNTFLEGVARPVRGLNVETLSKYGAFTKMIRKPSGEEMITKHIYPYYDAEKNLIAQKVRRVKDFEGNDDKGFEAIGDKGAWNKVTLFGQNVFPPHSAQKITVTEGEIDAMSVYQMLGSKYPAVSISNGAHSVRKQLENPVVYNYLDSFDEIIVCFDNDEHGQKAVEVFCDVFPHKTKVVAMSMKDANEYLMAGKVVDFVKDAWWKAKDFRPDGLALSSEFINDVVNGSVAKGALPYPYKGLNRKTFGMRQAELTTWVAGTGSGKSTVQREIVNHIKNITGDDVRIGMLMLEESPNKTATGLVGLQLGKPLLLYDLDQQLPPEERVLKDLVITKEEREAAAREILGSDRFVIMKNSFQGADLGNIVRKVRQMSKVYGCKHVILDHISIIVSGQDQGDERKALDAITTNLRRLVEETDIDLHLVSHLKRPDGKGFEDGAEISLSDIRGTGAIAQLSDNVIGLERNQQHEDPFLRNVIKFRVLKCRVTGLTGLAGYAYYNHVTGRVEPLTDEEFDLHNGAFEEKKKSEKESQQRGFKNSVDFPTDM